MKSYQESRLEEYVIRLESTTFIYESGFRDNLSACMHRCRECGSLNNLPPKKVKQGVVCGSCYPENGRETGAAHLYIMISDGYPCKVKIGFSRFMSHRTRVLKARTPFNFKAFARKTMTVASARELEKQLHQRLKAHQVKEGRFDGSSEWYHLTDEVACELDSLHVEFISDKVFSVVTLRRIKRKE